MENGGFLETRMSKQAQVSQHLAGLCKRWEEEVVEPFGFLAERHQRDLLKADPRHRRSRLAVIRYGTERILEAAAGSDHIDQEAENLFCALQDFFNVYMRVALKPFGIALGDDCGLDHLFYTARRQFIISVMPGVAQAAKPANKDAYSSLQSS